MFKIRNLEKGIGVASSYGTDADKTSLRSNYLAARRMLDPASKALLDERIARSLLAFDLYQSAGLVLSYVSRGREVATQCIIDSALRACKRVAVPRCGENRGEMAFYEISSLDDLVPGFQGIPEPRVSRAPLGTADFLGSICLVPGLVFDAEGHRIGYGGGYYDRFLQFYPGDKIGLARLSMVSSNPLPAEKGDVPVDFLATEKGIWAC